YLFRSLNQDDDKQGNFPIVHLLQCEPIGIYHQLSPLGFQPFITKIEIENNRTTGTKLKIYEKSKINLNAHHIRGEI
ncbi:hypothetical protein ACHAXS_010238, partial [Conticribra weissflogii]